MFASAFILSLLISLQLSFSLGSCSSPVFSVCWVLNVSASAKRPDTKIWLDSNELTPIGSKGKIVSLMVTTLDEHTLRAEYEGISHVWNFSVVSDSIHVSSAHRTAYLPPSGSGEALKTFQPNEVFPCENDTHYLFQKEDFIIALGHTHRFPLRAESRGASTLLVSWRGSPHVPPDPLHRVALYRPDLDGLAVLCNETTRRGHYRFAGLDGCRSYVACVEMALGPTVLCLTALTDPDVPRNFRVTAWDSNSVTVGWDCPPSDPASGLTAFLLTVFHVDGSGHVLEERSFRHTLGSPVFTMGNLPPYSRVQLGLQVVCQSTGQSVGQSVGPSTGQSRLSRMVLSDGNSANSEIMNLHQSSFGSHNYTVSWSVQNISSISSFKVYHQGELQSSTLLTWHTVTGLLPCHQYSCRVEALCGDSTVMGVSTIQTKTGPGEVLDLRFRQKDSIALWSGRSGVGVAFLYRLSERGGPSVRKGRLAGPPLPLPGLRPGSPYDLEVVPECEGGERGAPAVLYFIPEEVPGSAPNDAPGDILLPRVVDSADQTTDRLGLQVHLPSHEMFLVVPWTMPPSLEDPRAEARVLLEGIIKSKLQNLLSKFWPKAEVQLISFEDSERKTKTKITFESFDVSSQDGVVILRPEEQLQHIISLGHAHITVTDDSIYWDDPDECDSPALNKCSSNSICINTLDSFTCVCEPVYYSLSPILSPACHEKGMFTLCLKDHVSGGISKPFLIHYFGGNVTVVLNDGRCSINETDKFYYYRITGAPSQCGGQTLRSTGTRSRTHVELRNTLTVTLSSRRSITRRDLKVLWTCAYPLLQTSTVRMKPGLDWVTSHSVVQVNLSRLLEISMALYSDSSYAYNYTGPVELPSAEQLYIQVTLHCEDSLAYNMSLQLESCWATQTTDPQEEKKAFFLKGGCPNDRTFRWYLQSSSPQRKRFSIQMFTMSDHSHIYLHCLSRICSQDENCTTNCSPRQNQKVRRDLPDKLTATVSAGPISAAKRKLSNWPGAQIMLSVAGGLIGLFFLTALGVRAAHAITAQPQTSINAHSEHASILECESKPKFGSAEHG
ncbi:uncharacterized protein LOC118219192 [Anguilla anguilla]|uniref:uncharacterized protein LOC118219192 n=1 Tax=Anguilla anguilla TaxID=7936 RepID=UPI0015AA75BC|nr:uncharacterized protein LOC118219192 [Anguilla anguilla]